MRYKDFIINQLTQASKAALGHFDEVTGTTKAGDNNQVLTEADLAIGKQLVNAVKAAFPDHNIIDEETGIVDRESNFTWVIDPIDGTSNFAAGLPYYGVMIGLLDGAVPVAGGIALPAFQEIYVAERGEGAFCNDKQIRVSQETQLLNSLVAYGIDGHQEDATRTMQESQVLGHVVLAIRNLRTSNSAFDMAMVARGRYGAYLNQTTKIWDNVAPQIIIEEAGGTWTAFDGAPMNYGHVLERAHENFTVCAGAPGLHEQLQAVIHTHRRETDKNLK